MGVRLLGRILLAWALVTTLATVAVHHAFAMHVDEVHPLAVVATVWEGGEILERAVLAGPGDDDAQLEAALASHPGATLVRESIVGDGPVMRWPEAALAMSLVPGRDGLAAAMDGRSVLLTPDDLLARQAYDKGIAFKGIELSIGLDVAIAVDMLSERFGIPARDVLSRVHLRRFRVVRLPPDSALPPPTATTLSNDDVRSGAVAAASYLARGIDERGRFRYLVDAPTNRELRGYDWPRHAGATYFLAQVAALTGDADFRDAALRAAGQMRDHAMVRCGEHQCIGEGGTVDVGSTALAVLAFVEIARTRLDPAYSLVVPKLTAFLRAQQRPDGELMHLYDRRANAPVDVQFLYYTGEAAFALSRARSLLGDARDLDAAVRALSRLVHGSWAFFGSKYYWGEEHWTCQAMADLWDRAPDPDALDFCLGWAAYGRKMMYGPGDTAFDADGAYGVGPFVTPRLTPAGSRTEAGIATLAVARRAGRPSEQTAPLEDQLRRTIAMLLRHQMGARAAHLMVDPQAVDGAIPGTEVDWALRIDYEQHTGCALVRWLQLQLPPQAP
jgi:hypothetical protein